MLKSLVTNQSNNSSSFGYVYAECFATVDYGTIFLFCVMSLCVLVGAPAHSWCLWFYLRDGWRIGANQMFHVHHIIIELIMCLENGIEILNEFVLKDETLNCVDNFIFGACWAGRPLIQACVCIEQYMAVVHPVVFLKYKAMRYKLGAVGAVYLISSCYAVYEIIDYQFPDPVFNSIYLISVFIIIFCCVSVLRALRRSGPGHTHGNMSTGQKEEDQRKKKAFKIISANLFIKLFTFVPMVIFTVCYLTVDWILCYCVLGPFLASISIFSLLITPLLKMHKEGYLRCSGPGGSKD